MVRVTGDSEASSPYWRLRKGGGHSCSDLLPFLKRWSQMGWPSASVIVLEPDRCRFYAGNYSAYVSFRKNQALETQAKEAVAEEITAHEKSTRSDAPRETKDSRKTRKRKFPYRKLEDLEAEILQRENRIEQLHEALASSEVLRDGQRVKQAKSELDEQRKTLAHLYEHWEEAAELN